MSAYASVGDQVQSMWKRDWMAKKSVRPRAAFMLRRYWLLEAAACAISIGCFLGLIPILWYQANRPPTPLAHGTTPLNVMVAILSSLSKASLLLVTSSIISQDKWELFNPDRSSGESLQGLDDFDAASRGALGSTKLLWSWPWKRPLTTVAAIVTVLALAFDVFTQLVAYVGRDGIIRVHWPYLAVPGAMIATTTILLILTIRQAMAREGLPWKNNAMPLLFSTVDSELQPSDGKTVFNTDGCATLEVRGDSGVFVPGSRGRTGGIFLS